MKSPEDNPAPIEPSGRGRLVPAIEPPAERTDEVTGLPGLRSWRHVYFFVFACFVLWVLLLLALTEFYS
jgi:hypothetical protein